MVVAFDLWVPVSFLRYEVGSKLIRRMTGEQVNARKMLSSWTLHFEAKKTHDL